ncbi:hypothetical protein [Arthrobacter sp. 131MFCol6.1]|uniref:hypothetical protein n=1 Tax=Arthrobacter sp. 131MFCol6.1 TaxID=1157944 RepID=UPI0012DD286C|nr:hypothetical protein [Arthrobacter sp. 131MFCol6.1]
MSSKKVRPKAAAIKAKVPEWMMGGNPAAIAEICEWLVEPTAEPNVWSIGSIEGRHGTNGDLFRMFKLADTSNSESVDAYSRLRRLKRHDGVIEPEIWKAARAGHAGLARNYPEEASALLMSMTMLVSAAPTADAAAVMLRQTFNEFLLPAVDNPSAYLVEIKDVVGYRFSVIRSLLTTGEHTLHEAFKIEGGFAPSSKGLFSDSTLGFGAYLACMCASLSPAVWAYPIPRAGGVILLFFGSAVSGQEPLSRDKIQLLGPPHNTFEDEAAPADISAKAYIRAAQWWINQLSTLFSIVTEPANFEDSQGTFDPAAATERLLSVEQMFRDCQSILTITRDGHARRALTFSFLKRLEGMIPGCKWKDLVGRSSIEKILERLRTDLPEDAQAVFLGRAERSLRVVAALEDGFFESTPEHGGTIRLPDQQGKLVSVQRKTAVTDWLAIVRNSLHGFDKTPTQRDRALLAAHDGHIPGEFSDLAWLHLLDILAHPEKLARFDFLRRRKQGV